MQQVIIDCTTGQRREVELTAAEIETNRKRRDEEATREAAARAKREAALARVLANPQMRDLALLLGWASE